MAKKKNKNKGFALVEVIIAVAILTLLLTPIVKQLAQTMKLNRRAKAQQYATENAEYVLETFKAGSMVDLKSLAQNSGETNFKQSIDCDIYCIDDTDNLVFDRTIKYTGYKYILESAVLGSDKVEYERTVVMDDLEKSISALADDSPTPLAYYIANANNDNIASLGDFTVDAYGKVAQYDDEGFITAIVCKKQAGDINANPNTTNLGNMFDIDVDNMAVVTGETVEYDTIAAYDFYSEAMKRLKNSPVAADVQIYQGELEASTPGTVLTPERYLDGMNKLTKVSVTHDEDNAQYKFVFDVTYENTLSVGGVDELISKRYTIKTLTYDYDKNKEVPACPDIYFEYQPFGIVINDEGVETFIYAPNTNYSEHILFDSRVDDVKMYLIKPKWDQSARFANGGINLFEDNSDIYSAVTYDIPAVDKYYSSYYINPSTGNLAHGTGNKLVRICMTNRAGSRPVNVYTNLEIGSLTGTNPQFKLDNTGIYTSNFKDPGGTQITATAFNSSRLQSLDKDINTAEKLYSIRVELKPTDTMYNTVVLSGAKGVN